MTIRAAVLAAALLLVSCARSGWDGQLDQIRAEIQELERNIPGEAPLWPDEGEYAFNRYVEDNTPRIPDFVYNHVAGKLKMMSDGEIDGLVQPKFTLPDLLDNPPPCRGKVYRITGRIGHLGVERPATDASAKSKEVFSGTLFMGDQPVHFHVISKPDVVYLGSDEVEFSGVFIKVLAYPRPGEPTLAAPFFMAKSLKKYY